MTSSEAASALITVTGAFHDGASELSSGAPRPARNRGASSGRAATRSGWPEGYCPDCGSAWCRYREIQATGRREY